MDDEMSIACKAATCRANAGEPCRRSDGTVRQEPHILRRMRFVIQEHEKVCGGIAEIEAFDDQLHVECIGREAGNFSPCMFGEDFIA